MIRDVMPIILDACCGIYRSYIYLLHKFLGEKDRHVQNEMSKYPSKYAVDKWVTIGYHSWQETSMKFITVRDIRTSPAQIWKQLSEEQEMVITNNGKPIALLTPLSDANLEETVRAVRKARAINAVKTIREISLKKGTKMMNPKEIDKEIAESRKK
jgi:antitoxin (DNA-binding transcriptional repressor) of toxin-antitoxin stability system